MSLTHVRSAIACTRPLPLLEPVMTRNCNLTSDHGFLRDAVSSQSAEFAHFCGICTFLQNYVEFSIGRWIILFSYSNPSLWSERRFHTLN